MARANIVPLRIETPEPIKRSLVDDAYSAIRARILDNHYPPGTQALEQALADELNISRTPVREALIRLQNEGLVEVVPRHGMRVLPVSPADMKDIYEVLTALEPMAAALVAARKPSSDELKPLIEACKQMERALKADDLDAWARADEHFHRQLIELSGNRLLVQQVLNTWDRAHRARMFTLRLRPKPVHSTREHMAIVEYLKNGDAEGVFACYRAHRARASRELLDSLERYRVQQL